MLIFQRSLRIFPNFKPVLGRGFTTSSCLMNEIKKIKKRHESPKTLEDLLEVSKEKENTAQIELKEENKVKKISKKPIDIITTGPKVIENWRKMESLPEWKRQKFALIEKFKGEKWDPKKKISREEMKSIRLLKETMPELNSTELAKHFQISPEAVRRILKSKWIPSEEESDDILERWKKRGEKIKLKLKEDEKSKEQIFSNPKIFIKNGTDYDKISYSKDGEFKSGDGKYKIRKFGAKSRVKKLNEPNKLRKMKF